MRVKTCIVPVQLPMKVSGQDLLLSAAVSLSRKGEAKLMVSLYNHSENDLMSRAGVECHMVCHEAVI